MTHPRIVHKGSAVAQKALHPVGKQARVSQTSKELMEDLRQAACEFGAATAAEEVAQKFEKMQMRMYDLAYFIGTVEQQAGHDRDITMKF